MGSGGNGKKVTPAVPLERSQADGCRAQRPVSNDRANPHCRRWPERVRAARRFLESATPAILLGDAEEVVVVPGARADARGVSRKNCRTDATNRTLLSQPRQAFYRGVSGTSAPLLSSM